MKKRGPKSLLEVDPTLQKRLCDVVARGNTLKTAAAACSVSERSVHSWISSNPSFAAAVFRARAKAKMKLVRVITDAASDDWRAAAWILERSWPDEYARTERIEQIGEKADEKSVGVSIYYNTQGQNLASLLSFPIHSSMANADSPEVGEAKQRALLGEMAEAPAAETISDDETGESDLAAPTAKISDMPPPQVVNKALTGRIPPNWKGNGK